MSSDMTRHTAQASPDGWEVSWLPGRVLSRDQATTAMVLTEAVAQMQAEGLSRVVDHTHPMWRFIDAWAAELGLSGPDAVVRISEPAPTQPGETGHGLADSDPFDPGPVPDVVEPDGRRRVTTLPVTASVWLVVTEDVGNTGRTGLTAMTDTGEAITAALDARAVDDLVAALTVAVPVPYLPEAVGSVPAPAGGGR